MFQAPRPVARAPNLTAFTPAAAAGAAAAGGPVQSPPYMFGAGGGSSYGGGMHVAAVPIATSAHRPITVQAQKLGGSSSRGTYGSYGSSGVNRGPVPAAHFAAYSPQPSPISLSSSSSGGSGSSGSGVPSSSPATPAMHDPRLLGVPGDHTANGTPSPEPFFAFAQPQQGGHHVDIYVPQSPMVSPMMSPHSLRGAGDLPPAGGISRRDSVDEVAQAAAHLQTILWRNAGVQLQNAATLRHVSHHTMTSTPVNDSAQPNRGTLSSPKPTMSAEAPGTPTTSDRALSSHPASPNVASGSSTCTRAIPISRGDPHKLRLQPSVLAQIQAAEESSTPGSSGSRRGSVSNTAPTNQGSFISSSSPMGSSLSTSYTVLSHTPPQRSNNPQDHDCCFSPAQQAAYFKQLQSMQHTPGGSSIGLGESMPSLLPMMHSLPQQHSLGATAQQVSHSPTLRHSSLTHSLAQHQRQAAGGGLPTAPGTPQRAMLSKFASSPVQGFAPTMSSSAQAQSFVPPPAAAAPSASAPPAQSEETAAAAAASAPGSFPG